MSRPNATLITRAAAAALLFFATAASAGPGPLQPADLFDLEYAADPQVSPDGRLVAYQRHFFDIKTDKGRTAIWVVSSGRSAHQPLAAGSFTESMPRWSPDGRRMAYVAADRDGSTQVFVRYLDGGVYARVTNVMEVPSEMAWSPDGRSLALVMNVAEEGEPLDVKLPQPPKGAEWGEPLTVVDRVVYRADGRGPLPDAYAQLFVVPAEGGTPRQLTGGPYDHRGAAWSADGAEILVSANRRDDRDEHPLDTELYAVRVSDGELRALTQRYGPDRGAAVSPDGRRIAWVGFDDRLKGYQRSWLYVMDRDGGQPRELGASLDRDLASPRWWPDGRSLVVQSDDRGRTRLLRIFLDDRVEMLADDVGGTAWSRPYPGGSFSMSGDGRIAYTAVTATRPAEVAVMDRKGRRQVLTDLNGDLLGFRQLGAVEEVLVKSSADGREIQGWVVKPPGFDPARRYPLILEIHGGPFANYGPRFAAEMQLYAAAGYVVLYTNPRGSTSYGEEFGNLIHHAYPGQDYDDLVSSVDAMIARGYVDPERLYVTGGSGGGVLTAWIVGNTNRFKAAVVQKPVINWTSFSLTADATNFFSKYWFASPPWEDPGEYWRRSPLSLVGKVKTPTMLVTGEQDLRTPIAESEQFYAALKLRGVDTLLVRVPGAPHSLDRRPSQLIARNRYILAWFARYGGVPLAAPAAAE